MPRKMTDEATEAFHRRLVGKLNVLEPADRHDDPEGYDEAALAYATFAGKEISAFDRETFLAFADKAEDHLFGLNQAKAEDSHATLCLHARKGHECDPPVIRARLTWALAHAGKATREKVQAQLRDERRRNGNDAPIKISIGEGSAAILARMAETRGTTMRAAMEILIAEGASTAGLTMIAPVRFRRRKS